jgi:uncharacterized RDD family membrane protein YckC
MQSYQQFAVWPVRDGITIWDDAGRTKPAATVRRNARLPVLRREGAHYVVRLLPTDRLGYVDVAEVSPERAGAGTKQKMGNWMLDQSLHDAGLNDAPLAGTERASFGSRLGAYVIDYVIVNIALSIIMVAAIALFGIDITGTNARGEEIIQFSAQTSLLLNAIAFGTWGGYVWFSSSFGSTIGMSLLKLQIIDDETGRAPAPDKALIRAFVHVIGGIPLAIGYFWMLWDGEKKTLHDKAAGTSVVRWK